MVYSVNLIYAEHYVWKGYKSVVLEDKLTYFKLGREHYPFDYHFRIAASIELSKLAINGNSMEYGQKALPILNEALKIDGYSPELLGPAVIINYGVGNVKEAKVYYSIFKQTAKRSNFLDFMKGYLQ